MSGGFIAKKRPGLPASWDVLSPAGRVAAIAYSAGEADKIADALGWKPPAEAQAQGGGEVVERALEYLHPHLSSTFAAPGWAIQLASILTGGDGCGTPAPPSAPVGVEEIWDAPALPEKWDSARGYVEGWNDCRNKVAALAQQPAAIPRLANCGKYTATDNNGQHYYLNHANTWQTFQGQQPAAVDGAMVELRKLSALATQGELVARVIERGGQIIDAFLTVPSIEQGRTIAGPVPMEWLADDSYHEGGPEQKAHDARFTAAAVNYVRALAAQPGGASQASAGMSHDDRGDHVR